MGRRNRVKRMLAGWSPASNNWRQLYIAAAAAAAAAATYIHPLSLALKKSLAKR